MTRRTSNEQLVSEDVLAIHPDDAAARQINEGDKVRLFSARGEVEMSARLTRDIKPGILRTTFHFPEIMVNYITGNSCDEESLCPEYKVVAVDIERA